MQSTQAGGPGRVWRIGTEAFVPGPFRNDLRFLSLPASDDFFSDAAGPHRTTPRMREMKLQDLKSKTPAELVVFAEEHEVENASTMRKQELMFAILKQYAGKEIDIVP
jgi:hypothetical protein